MPEQYLDAPGEPIALELLGLVRARELVRLLAAQAIRFASLVDVRRSNGPPVSETVVFDVEVERSQVRVHDIHRVERVAVTFTEGDDRTPEVLALRADFPKTPHQNLRDRELPRSLCLYEQGWDQIKLGWAAAPYVERIRQWLAQTCNGALHQHDQPLEPLFFGAGVLILPPDLLDVGDGAAVSRLTVTLPKSGDTRVLVAKREVPGSLDGIAYVATTFRCSPQQHGVIRHAPANFQALHKLVYPTGLNLLAELRDRLRGWREPALLAARLIVIVAFPKTRGAEESVEATDLWAFLTASTVRQVGEQIGVWAVQGDAVCPLIGGADETKTGEAVGIDILSPQFAFSRASAALYNGLAATEDRKMVAVGAGALGSHVLTNLARAAFGQWTLVDHDYLLPHNLARHSLTGFSIGNDKVIGLSVFLNSMFQDDDAEKFVTKPLPANLLHPGLWAEPIQTALSDAVVILDMSADVPVARYLARDVDSKARRMSLFFNPRGTDLVLLSEDADRKHPLDLLEMQYYREVAFRPALKQHLMHPQATRVRYAHSCRDLSTRLPQDQVAILSGIGSRAFRTACSEPTAAIRLWLLNEPDLSVTPLAIRAAEAVTHSIGEWTLVTDSVLLSKVRRLRRARLPNETGGVLLGSFDLTRKVVYVVDTIASPPDSKEWPTLYIRGHESLPEKVRDVQEKTAGHLEYVGEWHAHPEGHRATPSEDDIMVFTWLTELMDVDGRPALMLIVGDRESNFFVGQMLQAQ